MADIPDEILMAYADGALDKETRARVEALLYQDAGARRRVEVFRVTGAPIAEVFDPVLQESVPERLMNFVLDYESKKPDAAKSWKQKLSVWNRLIPQVPDISWQFAAASAATLVIGSGVGWGLHSVAAPEAGRQDLAVFSHGEFLAQGSFAQSLETVPSNREVRVSGWLEDLVVMRPIFTFKNNEGHYCREYELSAKASGNFAGLACRSPEGQWTVELHMAQGAKAAQRPAGGVILDAVIGRMIDGDALGQQDEDAIIAGGWK